ncbi:MAG: hypothetical protein H7A33_01575 [Deltaproteobacteria bacterium]|nr:hypothetical protein [Deltaproteobacteria bacterium]
MKPKNKNDLMLQVIGLEQVASDNQRVLELEFALVNSAFAYEYARLALSQNAESVSLTEWDDELEGYRSEYLIAREQLGRIDQNRLHKVEADLQMQKLQLFSMSSLIN